MIAAVEDSTSFVQVLAALTVCMEKEGEAEDKELGRAVHLFVEEFMNHKCGDVHANN